MRMPALLALSSLLCAGCTRFAAPAVEESGPAFDSRLAGHWVMENGKGRYELEVVAREKSGTLIARVQERDNEPEIDQAEVITARLGRQTYASLRKKQEPQNGWTIVEYDLLRDQLRIRMEEADFWKDAVERRLISGTIDQSGFVPSVTVTADGAELRRFLMKYGSRIFVENPDQPWIFQRQSGPETTPRRP